MTYPVPTGYTQWNGDGAPIRRDEPVSVPLEAGMQAQWSSETPVYLSSLEASTEYSSTSRPKKLGKTCGECRRQHLRCDYSLREEVAVAYTQQTGTALPQIRCTRCEHRGTECTQVSASLSRYYPRPSRTGRRIELGRQLHGSAVYPETGEPNAYLAQKAQHAQHQQDLSWPRLYLRMIKTFFTYTHSHFPTLSYEQFSYAFNASYGDLKRMAQCINDMADGKGPDMAFNWAKYRYYHRGNAQQACTPETLEVLISVMLAWAARHMHLPFDSLDPSIFAKMGRTSLVQAILDDPDLGYKRMQTPYDVKRRQTESSSPASAEDPPKRRVKRRQGVACDTCRLRRVRCDLMEQPPGSNACSRCRVKRIVCTDRYIQWKQQRDSQKTAASHRSENAPLPLAVTCVQLLPEVNEFELDETLSPSTLSSTQQELLECGIMRENVCNLLLNRALMLVNKYKLQHTCNVQSAQCLLILATLMDYTRPEMALSAQFAAVRHLQTLFPYTHIDLTGIEDPAIAHDRLYLMFSARTHVSGWVHDAIFTVSFLRLPGFSSEWLVVGERCDQQEAEQSNKKFPVRPLQELRKHMHEDVPVTTALLLVLCSSSHLGRIAHRISEQILLPLQEQSSFPSLDQVKQVSDKVHNVWEDLYFVESAHQFMTRRARPAVRSLRAMSVVHWTTMVYTLLFILYHTVTRKLRDWFITNNSQLSRGSTSEEERSCVLDAMRSLLQESQERLLSMCRVFAHLARSQRTTSLMHCGSALTRQLFRIAQILARAQPVEGGDEPLIDRNSLRTSSEASAASVNFLLNPAQGASQGKEGNLRKREHDDHATGTEINVESQTDEKSKWDSSRPGATILDPEMCLTIPTTRTLPAFTKEAKREEIDACIEALGQIGFAFAGLETEIRRIVDIVQAMG
ncbi:hypothetical protein MPSI1_002390 [Malassezia psittaci]|uniref:Zn(2)-C6 fungal-type domain-containing protein n=1 Tax=Malassezia psittaci TaxID=1821823 RepID=A0AAF0JKZ3_9BASI|nr:hypothetical protein MPSI1_002390 [Malassezia psittaci]